MRSRIVALAKAKKLIAESDVLVQAAKFQTGTQRENLLRAARWWRTLAGDWREVAR